MTKANHYTLINFWRGLSSHWLGRLFNLVLLIFLFADIILNFYLIFNFNVVTRIVCIVIIYFCMSMLVFPGYLRMFLVVFAFSFSFFGFQPYDIHSHVFEFFLTGMAISLTLLNLLSNNYNKSNRHILILLFSYILLSVLSLQMLPVKLGAIKNIIFYDFNTFKEIHISSLTGVNRLIMFSIFAFQLSISINAEKLYKYFFIGLFCSAIFSALTGLADFYGLISLTWYRQIVTPGVLHGFFLNRGWFAQFIMIASPLILIGFLTKNKGIVWKVFLFAALIACEVALILSGARAGWVSYPLVLFFSWLFVHFFKGDENKLIQLRWREILKVFLYMPVTVLISLFLIFQVLPYLSKLNSKATVQTAQKEAAPDPKLQAIKEQSARVFESGNRLNVWKDGLNVGRESPIVGLGYDSFVWQARILDKIPGSYFKKGNVDGLHETPHNTFLQAFVSGGLIGLSLWLLIIGYALMVLVVDLVKNRNLLNIPVIISIIVSHIHGIFQDLQYIPMIWAITIIELGYVMTISENILQKEHRKKWDIIAAIYIVVVLISGFIYYQKSSYDFLKVRYGIKTYKME